MKRRILIGVAAFTVLLAGGLLWLLLTEGGARFALGRATSFLAPRLTLNGVSGTLAGPLRVSGVRWNDPETGVEVTLASAETDLTLRSLFTGTLRIDTLALSGLRVNLTPVPPKPEEPSVGNPFEPPLDIRLDRFTLRDAVIASEGLEQLHLREAALAGEWTKNALIVRQLDVLATEGEVHFAANVTGGAVDPLRFDGGGEGRFRWTFGERQVTGTLKAQAADALAHLEVRLSEPTTTVLTLSFRQQDRLPWTYKLLVPAFDPRERLLPDSSLEQLALDLEGSGSLDEASSRGRIGVNGTAIDIQTLQIRRAGDDVALDGRVGFGGGIVTLAGTLQPQAEPIGGRFDLQWQDVTMPPDLVGQELQSGGRVTVGGSLDSYAAEGTVRLGPPGRLATIELRLTGTPEIVQLARFDIVQPRGRLAAAGIVRLKPETSWTIGASGTTFDPGAFFVDWPGRLDFRLGVDGRLRDGAVEAHGALQDLNGRLRDRRIAGKAELQIDADRTLVGDADVSSGGSRVRIEAKRDADGKGDANARIAIATLADWLPDARGSVNGTIDADGVWPDLNVRARLRGEGLSMAGTSARTVALEADITRPLEPSGRVALNASGVVAAGFDFATLALRADGDAKRHQASFDAAGPRLTLGIDAAGGLENSTWSGNVSRLGIAAPGVARLALQAPFAVSASARTATLGQACLADGDIRLCVEGDSAAFPAFQAKYGVRSLPLKLAQAFVDLPVGVEGTLDGDGNVQRDAQGAVAGEAHIRSASGRVTEVAVQGDEPRELLNWRDLVADASLQGDNAVVETRAVLNEQGRLDARVAASALTSAAPQLDGRVALQLPGIGVIEAFAPQLMNVEGSLGVDARITGSADAPQIDGEARLGKVGFDLPELGLKPREGELVARLAGVASGSSRMALDGSLRSGEGRLTFKGDAGFDGDARVQIEGKDVLAADIPGVSVTLTPTLTLTRDATRTLIEGKVAIPKASVDLQRLPSAKRTRSASPDVVVVDDADAMAAKAQASPLSANISVTLGDDVKLKGYGLDATVAGEVDVRERPGEPTTGSGEVRVAGKYQAYGQDLTIQQGQLLFAGTPIDNPRLAIVAIRQVDTVTAGFRVSGNARNPELSVFSDPAMGQASALSYIVAGKPLDQIGSGTGEGDALQSAARQLGTAAGGLLAKNVGKRLGVDELGIKDSASIGGAALTVGQYLSPRLYLGYGIGLFDPGQVVTLRYRLSRELALEAEQGTINSRAGIEFRKEK